LRPRIRFAKLTRHRERLDFASRGYLTHPGGIVLSNFIADFIIACKAAGLAPKTVRWYSEILNAWSRFVGDRDFRDPQITREFIASLQARTERYTAHPKKHPERGGLSAYTIRAYVRAIRRFFNWLVQEGRIDSNPAKRIQMPKKPKLLPRALDPSDFERLLGAALCRRDRALLYFLRDTGCRVSELCGLRVRDVDLGEGVACVIGKGEKQRFVFFRPETGAQLKTWLEERVKLDAEDWLFITEGRRCQPSTIDNALGRMAARAKVRGHFNAHSFRHAFGRDWVVSGGDVTPLADVMGHEDIATTRIYLRFKTSELKAMHAKFSPFAGHRDSGDD
jgi:integrase/recombinase XerC